MTEPFYLGIVGSEGAKFTPRTEELARSKIRDLIDYYDVDGFTNLYIVSGACHLGGIDRWAVEEARRSGLHYIEYPPSNYSWSTGYKPRNIQIAERSNHVACITLRNLPSGWNGMRFRLCYHCNSTDHVKSGGCWTVKYAKKIGKTGEIIVID